MHVFVPTARHRFHTPDRLCRERDTGIHSTEQPALPPHSAVQPPAGHLIVHVLLPSHVSVDPLPSVTAQSAPPEHVTVLLVPVCSVHLLVPAQLEVQPDPQLP